MSRHLSLVLTSLALAGAALAVVPQPAGADPAAAGTQFSTGLASGANPSRITSGPDGNLWFTEPDAGRVGRITPAGVITEFGAAQLSGERPYDITASSDNQLWFTESQGVGIGSITTSGTITEYPLPHANSGPAGITKVTFGPLWFTEATGNRIGTFDTVTHAVTEYTAGLTANAGLEDITLGPDGNLWFTESNIDRIGRITPAGVITEFSTGITPGSYLQGIATGPDGNLWFTENVGHRIGRITTAGVVTEFALPADKLPTYITSAPDGNLWFGANADDLGRITTAGVATFYSAGPVTGKFPFDVTTGPDGNLWYTEPLGLLGTLDTNVGSPAVVSAAAITIPSSGTATPYPSTISVPGSNRRVTGITVELTGLSHTSVADVDILLTGPNGQKLNLFRSSGVQAPRMVTLRFSDTATATLPVTGSTAAIVPGVYQARNPGTSSGSFPGPAPASPYSVTLADLVGTQANGTWSLFVRDTAAGDSGTLAGWGLDVASEPVPTTGTVLVNPVSPANNNFPTLTALFLEAGSTIRIYDTACTGTPLATVTRAQLLAGVQVEVPDDSFTNFRTVLVDSHGNESACTTVGSTYVEDSTAPTNPPTLTVTPGGPANDNSPLVKGTADGGSTVYVFSDAGCSTLAATGTAYAFTTTGIAAAVPDNSTTTFRVRIEDLAGNTSACSSASATYTEDSTPPGAPAVSTVTPTGPDPSTTPTVTGTADPGSTVRLYGAATCAGSALGTGSAAAFATGIAVTVPTGTTTIYATASDPAGNTSACSTSHVTYVQDATAPDTAITAKPAARIKTTKKKVTVTFSFTGSKAGATFTCSFDGSAFVPCTSPRTYKVKPGKHSFAVIASWRGISDPSPATYSFKVKRRTPR